MTAAFTAAAAVGTVAAVLVTYAVMSLCAALISESAAGVFAAPDITGGSLSAGAMGGAFDGDYVSAMASIGTPTTTAHPGDAVYTSAVPDDAPELPHDSEAAGAFGGISVSAECAVLLCADTGEVLYAKNADLRHPMASTTKIMTALVALESASLEKTVRVSADAVGIIGSSVYLYAGEELTMESLLYALMLESANDAAAAIAIDVAGDIDSFADLMNAKAQSLGLVDTHYTNPHGLDSEGHYTTARELAALTAEALKNETFRSIVSTYKKSISMHSGEGTRLLINHNRLLRSYDGSIGVKTGYTSASGRCLVSAAERGGLTFIAVTLNAPDDWNDHREMLDAGFRYFSRVELASPGSETRTVPVTGAEGTEFVRASNKDAFSLILPAENAPQISAVTEMQRFFYAPVQKDDCLGRVVYYNAETGERLGEVGLYADSDVAAKPMKKNIFEKLRDLIGI